MLSEEDRFKKNAEGLSTFIQSGVQKLFNEGYQVVNPGMIMIAGELIKSMDPDVLITGFIKKSHQECWDKIKERDETFFITHASTIFANLPSDTVNLFKDLYETKNDKNECVLSNQFKLTMWEFFDALVKISIKYAFKHNFDYIDIDYHTNKWDIKFEQKCIQCQNLYMGWKSISPTHQSLCKKC